MYDRSDPRFSLQAGTTPSAAPPSVMPEAHVARFYEEPCQDDTAEGRTWYQRGQTFMLAYSEVRPGAVFARGADQQDEYVVLLQDPETPAVIHWNGVAVEVPGHSIAFVPQGASSVSMPKGGRLVRLFTERAADLLAKCPNNDAFAERLPNVPELRAWPEPPDGLKVRHYSLAVAPEAGRFGRIFRCTTFMINVFDPAGPRDPQKMSPHHHDHFEQCSLALAGSYDHLLRWPWTPDMTTWKADAREHCASPSSTIIPPPVIHTSLALSDVNQLVDIFCPPRRDFSEKPGWVLNADDYPMPAA